MEIYFFFLDRRVLPGPLLFVGLFGNFSSLMPGCPPFSANANFFLLFNRSSRLLPPHDQKFLTLVALLFLLLVWASGKNESPPRVLFSPPKYSLLRDSSPLCKTSGLFRRLHLPGRSRFGQGLARCDPFPFFNASFRGAPLGHDLIVRFYEIRRIWAPFPIEPYTFSPRAVSRFFLFFPPPGRCSCTGPREYSTSRMWRPPPPFFPQHLVGCFEVHTFLSPIQKRRLTRYGKRFFRGHTESRKSQERRDFLQQAPVPDGFFEDFDPPQLFFPGHFPRTFRIRSHDEAPNHIRFSATPSANSRQVVSRSMSF